MAAAAALAVLAAAAVVVVSRDDEAGTSVAAGAGMPSTSTTTAIETTTTSVPIETTTSLPIATTLPSITVPKRPRPPATTTTTTTAAPAPARVAASPLEPGTQPWGYGDLGASREVTQGRTRVVWAIYMRDAYKGEPVQTFAQVHDEGVVTAVQIDFGDGSSWDANERRTCDPASMPSPKPNPIHYQASPHEYGPSGDYRVTVRVTTVSCREWEATRTPVDEHTVAVTLTLHRHADRCRPSPDCPG